MPPPPPPTSTPANFVNYQPGPPETRGPAVSRTGELLSDLAVGADRGFDLDHDQADESTEPEAAESGEATGSRHAR